MKAFCEDLRKCFRVYAVFWCTNASFKVEDVEAFIVIKEWLKVYKYKLSRSGDERA